jgi:hypothetical protein
MVPYDVPNVPYQWLLAFMGFISEHGIFDNYGKSWEIMGYHGIFECIS